MNLTVGSRRSRLAVAQTELVIGLIRNAWPVLRVDVRYFDTFGDLDTATPIDQLSVTAFTDQIDRALTDGDIDAAVHSFKDLPTRNGRDLMIGAIPARADPRDALVSADGSTLSELPSWAVIGVSSERRASALLEMRNDLVLRPIRGAVEDRVQKVDAGQYDATVLAVAGLERLGLQHRIAQIFSLSEMPSAAGQGALAVECRAGDAVVASVLRSIDDPVLHASVLDERRRQSAADGS